MKMFQRMMLGLFVSIASIFLPEHNAHALPFVYKQRDLMLAFRVAASGVYDLEVDIGSVSNYLALSPGASITITQFTRSQLSDSFSSLAGISWSVGTYVDLNDHTSLSTYPPSTLWITQARTSPSIQTTPWVREGASAQRQTAVQMSGLANGAVTSSSASSPGADNTATVIRIASGDSSSCDPFLGTGGDYNGTWEGTVENTTPTPFTSPVISDFYAVVPSTTNGNAVYLGTFQFATNGTLTFTAATTNAPPPPPPVLTIARSLNASTISLMTANGANYTIYYTNSAGFSTPTTNWPVLTNFVGSGTLQSVQDNTTSSTRFYQAAVH
jgi:hypothetical protein